MNKLEQLYEGKAKKVFKTEEPDYYLVEYKDDATAFNGEKKGSILDKGVVNNKMSALLFQMLEEKGIPTHFEKLISDREQYVKAVKILPLEVIVRNIAAGSLAKRLGLEEGVVMKETVLEFCYKDDALGDPMINDYHIYAMEFATKEQVEAIKVMSLKINELLLAFFLEHGLKLVDFKLEFGLFKGQVILADEISPDTCRLWDAETNKKMDKDRFRRDLGDVEQTYQEVLSRIQG
ncbi:phosphoribosylaminoimidazolesuccinocarboxamide synthase [Fusibacter bizertensis]|jgi:phosphoribosylaminoimidazole-succinocarboxamide synthase (EC 6.3.2.6)|uniref:Phosphoribosylaminoimidazole-succinocarboxamide synthase n=1 Tax=Fusibacter bizertensis TaxID=1488331 RepID=A0ABT6NEW0_9FIRM|nr:phosphoribosylaminoimidazolesuccinocarboxamide synthase [Fusibacter bizertensis]MDH8678964.1 phosphoribosylaminoimidazolesuccinocarboxamide synthase [Fusibacter bizertensis]